MTFLSYAIIIACFLMPGIPGINTPIPSQGSVSVSVKPHETALAPFVFQTIEVWVNDVENLVAFEVELHYDPQLINVSSLALGDFLIAGLPAPTNGIDTDQGIIHYGMAQISGADPKSGKGCLFTFDIQARRSFTNNTDITLYRAELVDHNYFLIPTTLQNGLVNMNSFELFLPLIVTPMGINKNLP